MKQLQYRMRPYINQAPSSATEWKMYGECTVVSKDFKEMMNTSSSVAGEAQYRLVDTKAQPEMAMAYIGGGVYKQPVQP